MSLFMPPDHTHTHKHRHTRIQNGNKGEGQDKKQDKKPATEHRNIANVFGKKNHVIPHNIFNKLTSS